jgi:hypothetical protein
MEPAAERREHDTVMAALRYSQPPQWSPPLNGENTR